MNSCYDAFGSISSNDNDNIVTGGDGLEWNGHSTFSSLFPMFGKPN